jgi:prephenate dehydrogenase
LLKIKNENLYNRIGLIGGSMALDIKGLYPEATVYGVDTDEDHLQEALALGVVDAGAQIENLSDADFVILSVPVDVADAPEK